jgi:hypothetical protein
MRTVIVAYVSPNDRFFTYDMFCEALGVARKVSEDILKYTAMNVIRCDVVDGYGHFRFFCPENSYVYS